MPYYLGMLIPKPYIDLAGNLAGIAVAIVAWKLLRGVDMKALKLLKRAIGKK